MSFSMTVKLNAVGTHHVRPRVNFEALEAVGMFLVLQCRLK